MIAGHSLMGRHSNSSAVKGIKDSVLLTSFSLSLCFSVSARYMATRIPVKPGFRIHMTHKQLAPQEQDWDPIPLWHWWDKQLGSEHGEDEEDLSSPRSAALSVQPYSPRDTLEPLYFFLYLVIRGSYSKSTRCLHPLRLLKLAIVLSSLDLLLSLWLITVCARVDSLPTWQIVM
jgi:hypothetical protein